MNSRWFLNIFCTVFFSCMVSGYAQEKVYVTTDKECYLAGENLWCSVFCIDSATGKYSSLSSVAYLDFFSGEKLESTIKVALVKGRGCGKLQIPFSFATGNYSIVAYTRKDGGDSQGEFNGKIVTVFNTLTSERVKGGVELAGIDEDIKGIGKAIPFTESRVAIEAQNVKGESLPVKISNLGDQPMQVSVSIYHMDSLVKSIGERGYDNTSLLDRSGQFAVTADEEYAGEVIRARLFKNGKPATGEDAAGVYVYMSAMGNTDDVYVANADSLGYLMYYTNNISGKRDLLFDVVEDATQTSKFKRDSVSSSEYKVELVKKEYMHTPAKIPVLKISQALKPHLERRSMMMKVERGFEADTLYNLMRMRSNDFFGAVTPIVYNLDDYTRFPVMREVVFEYVENLRIREVDGKDGFVVQWNNTPVSYLLSRYNSLILLDGVPVRDHSIIIDMDPLLVKQIIIYPRRYVLNHFVFDGIVKFNTYKGDMGGKELWKNTTLVNYDAVQYPAAFLGDRVKDNSGYPKYNSTIYWNPVLEVDSGEEFAFECVKPQYSGEFKIVVEGMDTSGNAIYMEKMIFVM